MLARGKEIDQGGRGLESLPKPRVNLKVEGKTTQFLVDTGAQHSVPLQTDGLMSKKHHGCKVPLGPKAFMDYLKSG